jgi:hypothetical protein
MNTRLNVLKDRKAELKLKNEDISQERIYNQTKKCEEKFDLWQRCIKKKSWNDEECVGKLKPKYEYCIQKRNIMQTLFDNRLDEEY